MVCFVFVRFICFCGGVFVFWRDFLATLVIPVDKGMEAYKNKGRNTSLNVVLVDLYSSGKNSIQSRGEV